MARTRPHEALRLPRSDFSTRNRVAGSQHTPDRSVGWWILEKTKPDQMKVVALASAPAEVKPRARPSAHMPRPPSSRCISSETSAAAPVSKSR